MDILAIIDYIPAEECCNEDNIYQMTCYKCGKCGRKFANGVMTDEGGTHISEDFEE